ELCRSVPAPSVHAGPRHVVSSNPSNLRSEAPRPAYVFSGDVRNNIVAKDVPCGFPRFIAVEGPFRGGYFAITRVSPVRNPHEHDMPVLSGAEARLERLQQPHPQLAYFNLLDTHAMLPEPTDLRFTRLFQVSRFAQIQRRR